MLDEHIEASEVKSLLGREVSILGCCGYGSTPQTKSAGSAALVMKNKLKHTIKTGKGKDPAFFGDLEEELERLIQDEREGRIEQALFLEQLELLLSVFVIKMQNHLKWAWKQQQSEPCSTTWKSR